MKTPIALLEQAAAIGLTYLAAWLGLVEYARLAPGETLLVIGANGGVGSAVAQIGKWRGARVIGADALGRSAGKMCQPQRSSMSFFSFWS